MKRRLSFTHEDITPSLVVPTASPETMPGEIFQLENIVEEPGSGTLHSQDIRRPHNRSKLKTESESVDDSLNQSMGSSSGAQLETSITSNTSIHLSETSYKEGLTADRNSCCPTLFILGIFTFKINVTFGIF